jgi:hypothetical protein
VLIDAVPEAQAVHRAVLLAVERRLGMGLNHPIS